MSFV
jgi:Calpain family cysteine protease